MNFVFITKIIPNPLKNDIIVGDIVGVFFQIQMIWHNLFWKAKWRLKMLMKKNKSFIYFEMLEEG
jgi:hypothetical protein